MATVPVYSGPQVRSNALQPVQQREIDVSSGLRAAAGALGQVADLADRQVRRDVETEINTVDTKITAGWRKWDADNRRHYQGERVGEYEAKAAEWWDKTRETYSGKLSPMAQRALGQALDRKREQALGAVSGYVNAEKERVADQAYDAAQNNDIEFAVDTGDYAGMRERVKKRAAEFAARKGFDTDQTIAEQQRRLGAMHLTAITVMAERDPAGASKYFEQNKGEIPAQAQVRARQVLDAELENAEVKALAAKNAALPLAEQLAAGADLDPRAREKYLTEVRNNHAMVKQAQAEQEAAASDEAWQLIGSGRRVPEQVLVRMNGRERVQLQDYLRDRAKQAAAGTAPKTDWNTYIDAREKLAAGEKVDLRLLTTKIAPAQLEQLLDIQTKTRDPKKAPEVATSEQQIAAFTRQMDLKGEKLGQFQAAAYDLFNEHLKAKGKEPTFEERQAILDGLTKDIVIKERSFWFDETGPAFTAPREVRNAAVRPATADRFETGKVYRDSKTGARARYLGGGNWEPVQ